MSQLPSSQRQKLTTPGPIDVRIATLARKQHGMVATRQLRALSISDRAIWWRVRHQRLHRIYRGVFAVGHSALSREARHMAAVLACGEGAAISHASAAQAWGISRFGAIQTEVMTGRRHHGLADALVHQSRNLRPADVVRRCGIPTTTVARTLVDLADRLTAHQLANLIHEAAWHKRLNAYRVRTALDRNRSRKGYRPLLRALELHELGSAGTKSRLEDAFLSLVLAADLPEPLVNVRLEVAGEQIEVDCRWEAAGLCVEVDGPGHDRPTTQRQDAHRDRLLRAAGYTVERVSASMLERDSGTVVELVRRHIIAKQ